jgi:site-specific recombinase XerC
MIGEMERHLDERLYNPITRQYAPAPIKVEAGILSPKMDFIKALKSNYPTQSLSDGVKKELRRILNKIESSAYELKIEFPICEMHSGHVRDLLDNIALTSNEYNKYLTHLSIVLSDLVEKRLLYHNPIRDIKKKKTVKKMREVLDLEELRQIFFYLKNTHYEFYRYGMIFFHSGSRTSEMFRLQSSEVYLKKKEFKITIEKGAHKSEVIKPILPDVVKYWIEVLEMVKSPDDYIFGAGLVPNEIPIQPYQITKRWKRLVKDKLCFVGNELWIIKEVPESTKYRKITADFYALKHLFLDELDKMNFETLSMSGHTKSSTTEKFYLTGKAQRKVDAMKERSVGILSGI